MRWPSSFVFLVPVILVFVTVVLSETEHSFCEKNDKSCSQGKRQNSQYMASYQGDADTFLEYREAIENLDVYIAGHLQPTEAFNRETRSDIDTLAGFFRSDSFKWSVSRVVKGGSLGKGTHLKDKSDIDLVVFLNGFKNHQDFLDQREDVFAKLGPCIKNWRPELLKVIGKSPGGWQVHIRTSDRRNYMEGDILLAHDNLQRLSNRPPLVYREMRDTGADFYSYSYSLNQLQKDFIQKDEENRPRSPKLKNLIRLVKKWKDHYLKGLKNAPVNYALELITIHAWQNSGKPDDFNTKNAFRTVMELLVNYKEIDAVWEVNYSYDKFSDVIPTKERPLILDPANPFYNVAKGGKGMYNWEETSKRAKQALKSTLLSNQNWHS